MDSGHPKEVAIVTGSNTGIGRETALSLAKDGMKVFMACRSADRGHEAASYIREACPEADVEVLLLDLKTLDSVRKCATDFKSRNLPLKLLVNNAGVTLGTPWYTDEGVGGSAQVNYLGHYVLTRLLEDSLVAGAPSRVVNVSSIMGRGVTIPDPEKFFKDFRAGQYAQAKLANILFSFELQRRWQVKGIQTCAVDPGAVMSDIWRRSRFNKPPISWGMKVAFAPTWDGATPVYHAATTPLKTEQDKTPLRLFARGGFAWWGVTKPSPTPILQLTAAALDWPVRFLSRGMFFSKVEEVPANPQAYDEKLASKLWSLSADIAGLPE
ncbi:hypothetical protein M758_2G209700 [Ceratodon purpureus]|nr:hypothetical protein M758_2G209700 [Ceratodon purpureus]